MKLMICGKKKEKVPSYKLLMKLCLTLKITALFSQFLNQKVVSSQKVFSNQQGKILSFKIVEF